MQLEGPLPQVRPPITVAVCMVDAVLTSLTYIKFQVGGSALTSVLAACAWTSSTVILSYLVDAYNRRRFAASALSRRRSASSAIHAVEDFKLKQL